MRLLHAQPAQVLFLSSSLDSVIRLLDYLVLLYSLLAAPCFGSLTLFVCSLGL